LTRSEPIKRTNVPMSDTRLPVRRHKILALAAAGVLLIGWTGAAEAALTYTNSTRIYACVNKTTKLVRVVTPRNGHRACRTTEVLIAWSKSGTRGATGATGPMGPQGPQGPAGPAGADAAPAAAGPAGPHGPPGHDGAAGAAGAVGAPARARA